MGHRLIRRCGIACMGLGALVGGPAITTLVSGVLHEISTPAEKQIPSWVYHTRDSARVATFAAAGVLVAGRLLYGPGRLRVYNSA